MQISSLRIALQSALDEAVQLRHQLDASHEALICAVCEDAKVEVALVPCGHTACLSCVARLSSRLQSSLEGSPSPVNQSMNETDLLQLWTLEVSATNATDGKYLGECHMCRGLFTGSLRIYFGSGST